MVLLVTSDNEQFVVDKDVAERSVLIKNMLEGKFHQVGIPSRFTDNASFTPQMLARAIKRYLYQMSLLVY